MCGLYRYAAIEEYIPKDPGAGVERPTVDRAKQHRTWLSAVELATLVRSAEQAGPTALALVMLMGSLGLRVGEMCSLNIEAITHGGGYTHLHFVGKGNRAADVQVPVPCLPALESLSGSRTEGPLMLNANGDRMDRPAAARLLRRLLKRAGIEQHVTPHGLRRSFFTIGLTYGISLYDMQRAGRHKRPQTTALYDMTASSPNRNATHQVAGFIAALNR